MSREHWPHEEEGQSPADEPAKKDSFWTLQSKPVSDEEFVEKIRKGQAWTGRWRWAVILFHVAIIGWIGKFAVQVTNQLVQIMLPQNPAAINAQDIKMIIAGSACFGVPFGLLMAHSAYTIGELIWGNRTADLLVKYHDLARPDNHM